MKTPIPPLATSQQIAEIAHAGQLRRDNVTPYIEHVRKVAQHFRRGTFEYDVAWLHDVIEDTEYTMDDIKEVGRFSHVHFDALDLLTHTKGQKYFQYIDAIKHARCNTNALAGDVAWQVKIADIASNLSDAPTAHQVKKYAAALSTLISECNS